MGKPQAVPNLIQGVSQQAPQQRRDSQCAEQFDCFNSPLSGCGARPPTEFVKLWPGRSLDGAFFHEVVRGDENYLTGVWGGAPFAIDLADGTDCTVTVDGPAAYLAAATPRDALRAQTVEDTTFLLNRAVRPAMADVRSPIRRNEALVFVRAPAFSTRYQISLSGPAALTAAFTTPPSDDNNPENASTSVIAGSLGTQINGAGGYVCELRGSTMLIYRTDGADFAIETSDGNGDDYMYAFKSFVSAYSKLPRKGFSGSSLKVQGENRTKADDFYVEFTGAASTGYWREVVGPGMETTIDPATMPHTLVNTGYRTFAFHRPAWSTRIAGDDETAKKPSFIGRNLKDIFHHQGRLALLGESGCVWSKARNPYTFFPDSVQATLATAPIDYALTGGAANKGSANLDFAVQINEALYLWAPRAQFRVTSGNEPFKQDTVEAPVATAYEYATHCNPLAIGAQLYMATEAGQFATIRSLEFNQGRAVGDIDVTSHVSQYIPLGIRGMVASDTLRCMFVYTDGAPDRLYVYNFLLQDREFAQSAWNVWRIPGGKILWASIQKNVLSILQQRTEGLALLRVNLTEKLVDPVAGAAYRTRLDMLLNETRLTVSYDPTTRRSSFTLPYLPLGPALRVITRQSREDGFTRGREFRVVAVAGATVTVEGDLRSYQFYVGQRITSQRQESEFFVRSDQGVAPADRLTIERFRLDMADTGYTRIEVQPDKGDKKQTEFSGRTLGSQTGQVGPPMLSSAALDAPVGHLAKDVTITLINDSFLPSYWQTAAYDYTAVGWSGQK